jgi:cation transport protein ChaC
MWVFAYGSLMWDGWESDRGCMRRALADLQGYQRIFNKASVRNWGTNADPCPTLNLERVASGKCRGAAFEFPNDRADEIRAYLEKREGKGFELHTLTLSFDDGSRVEAFVPIYDGKNVLAIRGVSELVRMIVSANGTNGSGIDYVRGVTLELARAGIDDPVVTELARHFPG